MLDEVSNVLNSAKFILSHIIFCLYIFRHRGPPRLRRCYLCGAPGHISKVCLARPQHRSGYEAPILPLHNPPSLASNYGHAAAASHNPPSLASNYGHAAAASHNPPSLASNYGHAAVQNALVVSHSTDLAVGPAVQHDSSELAQPIDLTVGQTDAPVLAHHTFSYIPAPFSPSIESRFSNCHF